MPKIRTVPPHHLRPGRYVGSLAAAAAAVLMLAAPLAAAATTTVVADGDFEHPTAPADSWITYVAGQRIKRWRVVSGSVDLVGAYEPGDKAFRSASGLQSVDLAGSEPGSISQRLSTVIGQSYTLRFAMAGNAFCGDSVKHMSVTWDGARVARLSFDTTGHTLDAPGWTYQAFTVTATTTTTLLKFRAAKNGDACGPTLDDVSVLPSA